MFLLLKKLLQLVLTAAWKVLRQILMRWLHLELSTLIGVVWVALILFLLLLVGKACG